MRRMPKKTGSNQQGVRRSDRRNSSKVESPGCSTFEHSPRILEITVPVPSPTPNTWVTKHWRRYHKIKKDWIARLQQATVEFWGEWKFGKPITQAGVTIHRQGIKLLDKDNLTGGVKPILDALIVLKFLADDGPDVLKRLDVSQEKVMHLSEQQTRITLRDQT